MADNQKQLQAEIEQLRAENAELRKQLDYTRSSSCA